MFFVPALFLSSLTLGMTGFDSYGSGKVSRRYEHHLKGFKKLNDNIEADMAVADLLNEVFATECKMAA